MDLALRLLCKLHLCEGCDILKLSQYWPITYTSNCKQPDIQCRNKASVYSWPLPGPPLKHKFTHFGRKLAD